MALKKIQIISRLTDNLIAFSTSAHAKSLIGLYDDARGAQDFYKGFFNILFKYELVDLDKLHEVTNYKAIDLGDKKARIAIQVTLQNDSFKINQTIKKFIEEELYKDYDRLIICVIGKKLAYTSAFKTDEKFAFNHAKDVWDDDYLIKQVDKIDDITKLEELEKFLKDNIEGYVNAEHLYEQDIKECILSLEENLGDLLVPVASERIIPIRTENYIEDKNAINNLSWEFFQLNIQSHMSYNSLIEDFLKNPINRDILDSYLRVTESIQNYYLAHTDEYKSFEQVFKNIFNLLPRSYDNQIDERKVKILLHNMYFNCDIGVNPVYA